ncbi:MAG TPA: hypothetical protein VLB45_01215 [Nitrosopumilaceae archaeon]|nr:hypothetical protein [Nitrosopumilaceae archaeon]
MKDPHNYRAVGWSMVAVAASLAIIGLLVLAIGDDAYFSDKIMKQKQAEFEAKKKLEQTEKSIGLDKNPSMASDSGLFILPVV